LRKTQKVIELSQSSAGRGGDLHVAEHGHRRRERLVAEAAGVIKKGNF
jgi:hypothetical protein